MMYDFLKSVEFVAELPEADLERLCLIAEEVRLSAGEELFAEGSPGNKAFIILEGELEIVKSSDGREVYLEARVDQPGQMIGEMALLEGGSRMASVRAGTDTVLLAIEKEQFDHILATSPAATQAMLRMVLRRWRNNEARLRQSEKMAQLGTFTAGIAHELNNPAAAVKRSNSQLEIEVYQYGQAQAQIGRSNLTDAQQDIIRELADQIRTLLPHPVELDLLTRSDREGEIEAWLEDQGVEEPWELAPTLVNLDYDLPKLVALAEQFSPVQRRTLFNWLNATYSTYSLLMEIGEGVKRISEIVKALKSYTYLDQAPVQLIDLHEGLNNSILILRHKLGPGIGVRRQYAPDLPNFQAYGSELNQVWTNLIDNAIDALNGKGQITVRTRQEGDWAVVEIEDNGPGIPPEIQSRIFDPFFTTKPPGQGTGLGLDISYNIVVRRHRGDVKLFSQPGQTLFQVWLPLTLS